MPYKYLLEKIVNKILILSIHYPPEISAGSFRIKSLLDNLKKNLNDDYVIDLITTMPHKDSINNNFELIEKKGKITIYRVPIPIDIKRGINRIIVFFYYAMGVLKITYGKKYILIFATTAKLMTGFLAAIIATFKRSFLYIDIRDIFTDTYRELYKNSIKKYFIYIFNIFEWYTISKADKINLVSKGFEGYFQDRFPSKKYSFYTNGLDKLFLSPQIKNIDNFRDKKYVLYVGNIGVGQGLEKIIPNLAKKLEDKIHFIIIGSGLGKKNLKKEIITNQVTNVEVLEPVQRNELINYYNKADILFIHLNDLRAFEKVLPSKLFEYVSIGKPIWAGINGYSRKFLKEETDNTYFFEPANLKSAIEAFEKIKYSNFSRLEFKKKYDRERISALMSKDILDLVN